MSRLLNVVGMDPSLNNWGMSRATFDPITSSLEILELDLIRPTLPKDKKIRQGELDILAANQLFSRAHAFAKDADIVCVEVPTGSQSARAMVSYATCTAVIGSLMAMGVPIVASSPTELKKIIGIKDATKQQMIEWVRQRHPYAPYPTYKRNGQVLISEAQAEHMCDSVVAIYAAMRKQRFLQLVKELPLPVAP